MGTLAVEPEGYGRKLEDLRTLFINMHHLINEYRPHQARESLILMMEAQIERCRAEVRGIGEVKARVEGILEGLRREGGVGVEGGMGEGGVEEEEEEEEAGRRGEEKRVWQALERELGGGGGMKGLEYLNGGDTAVENSVSASSPTHIQSSRTGKLP